MSLILVFIIDDNFSSVHSVFVIVVICEVALGVSGPCRDSRDF
jgi:hypothetical protein